MPYITAAVSPAYRPEACEMTSTINPALNTKSHFALRRRFKPAIDRMAIGDLVDVIRRNSNGYPASMAIDRIYEILQLDYPGDRFQPNFDLADLESQLRQGIRDNSPVVVAFIEDQTRTPTLWKWRIHFVEIAGAGAVISDLLYSIKSPDIGTCRAHSGLKEPLYMEPFDRASRLWTCSSKPWQDSSVTLAFFGHTRDSRRRLVSVRIPVQYPQA
jgi:hypothetical protein